MKNSQFAHLSAPLADLGTTYAVHFMADWKVDLLLVIMKNVRSVLYRFGARSKYRLEVGVLSKSIWHKFLGRRGRPPPTILSVGKLGASTFHIM